MVNNVCWALYVSAILRQVDLNIVHLSPERLLSST